MKSRFSDIVKIRQLKVDSIEREIQREYGAIELLKKEIIHIEKEILKLSPPTSGHFSLIQQYHIGISNMNREIHQRENQIVQHLQKIEQLKEALKSANMEVEKFKYLHDDEVDKMKQELKYKEQKDLDELAVLRYSFKS
jgi:flagellar export protein FliJ